MTKVNEFSRVEDDDRAANRSNLKREGGTIGGRMEIGRRIRKVMEKESKRAIPKPSRLSTQSSPN